MENREKEEKNGKMLPLRCVLGRSSPSGLKDLTIYIGLLRRILCGEVSEPFPGFLEEGGLGR